jgi:DNA-binding CsgD family transcriptional regulator
MRQKEHLQRQQKMRAMVASGKTLREIGLVFSITKQAVSKILQNDYTVVVKKNCVLCQTEFQGRATELAVRKYCFNCSQKISAFHGRDRSRELVRMRDNYTCQICGLKWDENMRRFDAHHLNGLCGKKSLNYDRTKNCLDVMITLCHKCHLGLHSNRKKMSNPRRLNEKKKKLVLQFRAKGMVLDKIAKKTNLSYRIVQSYVKNNPPKQP